MLIKVKCIFVCIPNMHYEPQLLDVQNKAREPIIWFKKRIANLLVGDSKQN